MTQQLPQRRLGDRSVSAIGLGAMPMSVREVNDEERGVATIIRALELGVTLIDTADAYSISEDDFGANERLIATALKEYAAGDGEVLVATKGGHTRSGTDWHLDGTAAYLRSACIASIERLGVERIDLFQHHRPDPATSYDETLGGLKALLDEGLIAQAGISNADPGQIRQARGGHRRRVHGGAEPVLTGVPLLRARDRPLRASSASPSWRGARWAACPTRATSATSGSATPTWPRSTTSARSRSASRGSCRSPRRSSRSRGPAGPSRSTDSAASTSLELDDEDLALLG